MSESCVAAALAEVMVYNEATKKWQPPPGSDGQVSNVQIMQHSQKPSFRIISLRETDGKWLLNCNIHQKLKYHSATATFHQWRDEHRQVYGLNFQVESDARMFVSIIGQAIDHLTHQSLNHHNEYQQPHPADNVYQDPHQHMMHIQSAPAFDHHHMHQQHQQQHPHDENQNANFRKSSQHPLNGLTQQQRRVSQSSNASGGNNVYQESHWNGANTSIASAASSSSVVPTPPATSKIPPAPPMPSAGPASLAGPPPAPPMPQQQQQHQPAPMAAASSIPPAPPIIGNIAPMNTNAPPPPPPPPPNFGMGGANGVGGASSKPTSLADQIKMRSQQLKGSGGSGGASQMKEDKPAPAPAAGNLMSELAATINKRKMTQAKADAVDSKSNTSNGSTDSGCGTATSVNGGLSNGGSIGSAAAKKWSVSEAAKPTDSPKTHRKLPSASSLFANDEVSTTKMNGNGGGVVQKDGNGLTNEDLERFKSELMLEVRLEIDKAKQEIIDVIKSELSKR